MQLIRVYFNKFDLRLMEKYAKTSYMNFEYYCLCVKSTYFYWLSYETDYRNHYNIWVIDYICIKLNDLLDQFIG